MWEKNRKIIDIVDKKTFQPRLRTRKEKPRFVVRRETLANEGLGWNKLLFSSQRGRIANSSIHQMQDSQRSLHWGGRSLVIYQLLALLKIKLTRISSLSPPPLLPYLMCSIVAFSGQAIAG